MISQETIEWAAHRKATGMEPIAYLKYLIVTIVAAHAIGLITQGIQFGIAPSTLLQLFTLNTVLSLVLSLTIFHILLLRGHREKLLENASSILLLAIAGMMVQDGFSLPSVAGIQDLGTTSALLLSVIVNVAAATTVFLLVYVFTESHSYLKKRTVIMLEEQSNRLRLRAFDLRGRYAGYDASRGNFITEIPGSYFHRGDDGTELLSLPLAVSDFTILVDAMEAQSTLGSYRLSITTIINWEVKDVRRIHYLIKQGSVQAYDIQAETDGKVWIKTSSNLPQLVERARHVLKVRQRPNIIIVPPPKPILESSTGGVVP